MLVWIEVNIFLVDLSYGLAYFKVKGEVVICDINAHTRTLHTSRVYIHMQSNFMHEKESDRMWKTLQRLDNSTKIITTNGTLSLGNEINGFTCRNTIEIE